MTRAAESLPTECATGFEENSVAAERGARLSRALSPGIRLRTRPTDNCRKNDLYSGPAQWIPGTVDDRLK